MMTIHIVAMKKMFIRRRGFQGKKIADFLSGEAMESVMKKITLLSVVLMEVTVERLRFGQVQDRAHGRVRVDLNVSPSNLFKAMTIV